MSNSSITNENLQVAQSFHQFGFNVLPVWPGKKNPCIGGWKRWYTERQMIGDIEGFSWPGSIAAVSGIGNLRCIDIDTLQEDIDSGKVTDTESIAGEVLETLGLPADYPWLVRSGSGRGWHIWIMSDGAHENKDDRAASASYANLFSHMELRWAHHYTILPPSSHESGGVYRFKNGQPSELPAFIDLGALKWAYESFTIPPVEKSKPAEKKKMVRGLQPVRPASNSYVQAAFRDEISKLAATTEGGRNDQLNSSAFSLGQFVGAGDLDEYDVSEALHDTAEEIGLGEVEIQNAIRSGLRAGIAQPRETPEQDQSDSELLKFDVSDAGNAEAVKKLFGEQIKYTDERGWMVWNGTHYESAGAKRRVWMMVEETLQRRRVAAAKAERSEKNERLIKTCVADSGRVRDVMDSLLARVGASLSGFDADQDSLNVKNGVLNLKGGTLTPHSPGQLFTYCSPVAYKSEADSSVWEAFLQENVAGGPEVLRYMQEALGYTLSGRSDGENFFYIYGRQRAGKGTLTEAIKGVLGKPLASSTPYATFTVKRAGNSQNFDLAGLESARFLEISETSDEPLNAEMTKRITGGGDLNAAYKYGTPFEFKVRFKMWFSSNYKLNADGSDTAFWTRAKVFEFPNARTEDTANPAVKRGLNSQAGLEGLLKWMIEGAIRWYTYDGVWPVPDAVKLARDEHRKQADSVALWFEDCCVRDEEAFESNENLVANYRQWCEKEGYTPKQAKRFKEALEALGLRINRQKRFGTRMARGVYGASLSD